MGLGQWQKGGRSPGLRWRIAGSLLTVAALMLGAFWWLASPFRVEIRGRRAESITLPGGEILTNESYLAVGFRDTVRHNQFFFQPQAGSAREILGAILSEDGPANSWQSPTPRMFRDRHHLALVIGDHIFLRGKVAHGWRQTSAAHPDVAAYLFLRTFRPAKAATASDIRPDRTADAGGTIPWHQFTVDHDAPFSFHDLNCAENILITRRRSRGSGYPEFLVFSAPRDDFPWQLDLPRSRAMSDLPIPADPPLTVEVSVITVPARAASSSDGKRAAVIGRPGAAEVFAATRPLSASTWQTFEYEFPLRDGSRRTETFAVLFAFADPMPDVHCLFWRGDRLPGYRWAMVETGTWVHADARGFESGDSRRVFFRVKQAEKAP